MDVERLDAPPDAMIAIMTPAESKHKNSAALTLVGSLYFRRRLSSQGFEK
jgi:hypothetical protein